MTLKLVRAITRRDEPWPHWEVHFDDHVEYWTLRKGIIFGSSPIWEVTIPD